MPQPTFSYPLQWIMKLTFWILAKAQLKFQCNCTSHPMKGNTSVFGNIRTVFPQDRISNSKPQAFCICGPTHCFNYTALLQTLCMGHSLARKSVNGRDPQEWQLWKIHVSNLIKRKQYIQTGLHLTYTTFWNKSTSAFNWQLVIIKNSCPNLCYEDIYNSLLITQWISTHFILLSLHIIFDISLCVHFEQDYMHSL